MKNKKGFTLVEMLVVLSVLTIIFLIVFPEITNVYKKARENEYERFLSDIFLSTEAYVQKNINKYPALNYNSSKVYVYFSELLESGYLKATITDPKNKKNVKEEDYTVELFMNDDNEYKYKLLEKHFEPFYINKVTQELLDNNSYGNYNYMNGTYLKGIQTNNYVWYNGFLWRLMGLNEDGTIRLITQESVGTVAWTKESATLNYDSEGYLKDWLNDYFLGNLSSEKNAIIQDSNWCINQNVGPYNRTDCTGGKLITAKVGLISADEFTLSETITNSTYYLGTNDHFWTLTPYNATIPNSILQNKYNHMGANTYAGVRPVINISPYVVINSGDGSIANPYILNQDINDQTGKLNKIATSGEYVTLNDKIYRVVSKNSTGTKLIYDGYYDSSTMYGTSTGFDVSSGIGKFLNNEVLDWLSNSKKIVNSDWYQGTGFIGGEKYIDILNNRDGQIKAKVGLIRIGEMLSSQSASISETKDYWVLNKTTNETNTYYITGYNTTILSDNLKASGYVSDNNISDELAIRPVIVVNIATTVTSGNGTLQNPYVID